ncbi:MAG: redox-regulated ATPase YchF [candidate division Zixibacteria bacterium]|nr:redox-regulated ATPase YchF [candidate division Zixibacteria bacterium]
MKLGILGKPQSGKTTVFNAAAGMQEAVGDFSQAVHRAVIKVPDSRLQTLAELVNPKKITPAEIEFLDAPGLSGKGKEGAGLEISSDFRHMDTYIMVVNAFAPDANPTVEIKNLIDELILLDQAMIESAVVKKSKKSRMTGDKTETREIELLQKLLAFLEQEKPLIDLDLTDEELKLIRGYMFLSLKPLLIVLNISEDQLANSSAIYEKHKSIVSPGRRELAVVCGKVEMELVALGDDEREMFMQELKISEPAVSQVIQKSYSLLGLISFLTAGEPEVRAWTIKRGTNAQKSAGVIHSDIERGFIRAEIIKYADYVSLKTPAAIKAAGKMRLEGKEYIVDDGDVVMFRFNV